MLSRRRQAATFLDDVVFWGIAVGVAGFVVALSSDVSGLIHLFVPLMGIALLIALVVHAYALLAPPSEAVERAEAS
jgi:hypothetical protein